MIHLDYYMILWQCSIIIVPDYSGDLKRNKTRRCRSFDLRTIDLRKYLLHTSKNIVDAIMTFVHL